MTFIDNLSKEEYEQFAASHPKAHFLQSYYWGEVSKQKDFIPYYVGLKNNNTLVATALILAKTKNHLTYMYIPRGFLIDYDNKELVAAFTKEIKKFAKKRRAFFVKIDPDVKLHDLDPDGNVIGQINNYQLVNYLKSLGYKHLGFNKNFEGNQPRYTFRLDVSKDIEELVKNYHATTRNIVKKDHGGVIEIYRSQDLEDIKSFYKTLVDTYERSEINSLSLDYYQNFFKILNEQNMSDLYIVKVDVSKLLKNYGEEKLALERKMRELDYDQKRNKEKKEVLKQEMTVQKNKLIKDIANAKQINQKEVVLSSFISVKYKDKVWVIHGGNSNLLRELNANYLIFHEMIKDAHNEGYQIFDFFGTTGDPQNSEVKGIHLFKKRFGGEYVEFIGEFDLVINKLVYFIYTKLIPILRKK